MSQKRCFNCRKPKGDDGNLTCDECRGQKLKAPAVKFIGKGFAKNDGYKPFVKFHDTPVSED